MCLAVVQVFHAGLFGSPRSIKKRIGVTGISPPIFATSDNDAARSPASEVSLDNSVLGKIPTFHEVFKQKSNSQCLS